MSRKQQSLAGSPARRQSYESDKVISNKSGSDEKASDRPKQTRRKPRRFTSAEWIT